MKRLTLSALLAAALTPAWGVETDRPVVYAVSDAHLDTQWNWDVQTTIRDHVWNTINRNLFLLGQYPDYVFNFEGGVKYAWMKEYYPREYELMKNYISDGRWHICGASWDANDVIMPSVESQIRNIMLGQNFYRDEFGVESTDIFLPDCFGFGWTLPTIASHCGLIGFSSQKLGWRSKPFYGKEKIPFTVGLWQGVDGARIGFAHGYDYNHRWRDIDLSSDSTLMSYTGRSPLGVAYRYYGTGDIGGSPTITSVATVSKSINGAGPLKIISATSDQMYRDLMPFDSHPELPVYDGELLMDVHGTGCYTSQAAMKLYNRQNELLGDAAERAATIAALYAGTPYPSESFTESWHRFIWHQFHDDLTGTSIPRAYEFSWNDELLSLKQFSGLLTDAVAAVAAGLNTNTKGVPVVFYNPLGYEVSDLVEVSIPGKALPSKVVVKDHNGKNVNAQVIGFDGKNTTVLVEATVPATGFAVYDVIASGKGVRPAPRKTDSVENSVYSLTFDNNGDITSIIDKRNGKELVKNGKSVRLALFGDNKSYEWPAWEIMKETIDAAPVSITGDVEVSLVEDGDLRKTVKVSKRHGDSRFVQYIRLYEGALADRIDFDNEVDWATTNALVKAEFPLAVTNEKATYDLGIGVAERGNNTEIAYEVPAQQWADLSDQSGDYGVTILNNSKYGWDKPDNNTLRLTLLHTPQTRKNYTYQDHQDFGHHLFAYSIIGHDNGLDRAVAAKRGEVLNQPVKAFVTAKHKGVGKSLSLASTDATNVLIKAVKRAEDGNGYIVRVYETAGKPTNANVIFSRDVKSANVADGTEKVISPASVNGNKLPVSLKANGIATYRVAFDTPMTEPEMKVASVNLPYNKKAMTWNEFRHNGDFSSGYTYAAEIVPEQIVSGGVTFSLCPRSERNALACKGDTIDLPGGEWKKLHILAAAATEEKDVPAAFNVGGAATEVVVPSYTGFIGQWGHDGHTEGFMKDQRVAFVGTHRHSSAADEPYEFTYMFHYTLDVPKGATSVILPDNKDVVVFAATVTSGEASPVTAAAPLFVTANRPVTTDVDEARQMTNILKPDMVVAWSGFAAKREHPTKLVDGDESTKWCDIAGLPSYVDFDLGETKAVAGWRMVGAAAENPAYVTSTCFLMGRNNPTDEWRTLDMVGGNKQNIVKRMLPDAEQVRYLRFMVTSPTQNRGSKDTRVYELEVFE